MKWLVLAVLLTVPQASSPIPGKAPNNATAHSGYVKKNSKADKEPTTPPSSQQAISTPKAENESKKVPDSNAQQSIRITEFPPVSVGRDWVDCISLILTGLLVLVGGFTLGAIWRQAREMGSATQAMRESTVAVQQQADIMKRSTAATERGLILLNRAYPKVDVWIPEEKGIMFRISNPSTTTSVITQNRPMRVT